MSAASSAPGSDSRPGSLGGPDAAGANAPVAPVAASAPGRAVPAVSPPLEIVQPPSDTPVKEVLDQLRAAADLGNPQAACRVALEMRRCGHWFELSREPSDSPLYVAFAPMLRAGKALCAGVDENDVRNNAWRYLWQAAEAGNVAAMTEFAITPVVDGFDNPAASADAWLHYRDHAREFLTTAVNDGDVEAAYWGVAFMGTGNSFGGRGVFKADPYTALVWAEAILPFLDPQRQQNRQYWIDQLEPKLPPDRVLQAQQDAIALRARMAAAGATRVHWPAGNDGPTNPAVDCNK